MMQPLKVSEVLANIQKFENTLSDESEIVNTLFVNFALLDFPEIKTLSTSQLAEAIGMTTKRLSEWVFFPSLKQYIYELPLVEEYEAVSVGFGVIVRPTNISKALLVINNTTVTLSKQRLLETIIKTLQAQPFARNAEPFFFQHLGLVFENLIQRLNFDEITITQEIIVPTLHILTKEILENRLDGSDFGVSDLEINVMKTIRDSAEKLLNNYPDILRDVERCLGFIKTFDLHGSANLNYELFSIFTKSTNDPEAKF